MDSEKDASTSWFRLFVPNMLDWRLVLAAVPFIVVLLMR